MSQWAPPPTVGAKVKWHLDRVRIPVLLGSLRLTNRVSRRSVTSRRGVVDVSLTTYGPRTADVFLAIESIGLGRTRPRRLILWLDDPAAFADPPVELRRLRKRGLDLRLTDDLGPHKKWWPYVSECYVDRRPLVLADDDVLYPTWWLRRLVAAHREHPDEVICHRAHKVTYAAAGIAPYEEWEPCLTSDASVDHFATGVGGVLYGPDLIELLRREGDDFRTVAPRADDVWLHFAAVAFGWKTRQVNPIPRVYPEIPGTRETGLHLTNVVDGGNDRQVADTMRHFAPLMQEHYFES